MDILERAKKVTVVCYSFSRYETSAAYAQRMKISSQGTAVVEVYALTLPSPPSPMVKKTARKRQAALQFLFMIGGFASEVKSVVTKKCITAHHMYVPHTAEGGASC